VLFFFANFPNGFSLSHSGFGRFWLLFYFERTQGFLSSSFSFWLILVSKTYPFQPFSNLSYCSLFYFFIICSEMFRIFLNISFSFFTILFLFTLPSSLRGTQLCKRLELCVQIVQNFLDISLSLSYKH